MVRALGGETGPSSKGWGTGPRLTPLQDDEAVEFLSQCERDYDQWAERNSNISGRSAAADLTPTAVGKEKAKKKALNLFYSHQDQVIRPPTVGGLR